MRAIALLAAAAAIVMSVGNTFPAAAETAGSAVARLYIDVRDQNDLDSLARAVTDPRSPSYRHFLSPADYRRRFALTDAQHRDLLTRLAADGIRVTGETSHYLRITGPAAAVARVAGASAAAHSLSTPVSAAADAAARLAGPQARVREKADADEPAKCSSWLGESPAADMPPAYGSISSYATCPYRPDQLRKAYHVTTTGRGRTVAIVGAYGSPTMRADADRFATAVGDKPFRPGQYREDVDPNAWNLTPDCAPPADWAGEQALDVETVHGYAPDAAVRYVGANSCLDEDLMDAESSIIDNRSADLITNSWAEIIHADPGHLTPDLVAAWNRLFEQAAVEGIGVYFASGDCGDASPGAAHAGLNCDPATTAAQAEWPAASPWVTAVGGTALGTDAHGRYAWETSMGDDLSIRSADGTAWTPLPGVFVFGGGGGPGDAPQPWYQRGVVPAALAAAGGQARRVTPDVALEGDFAVPVLVGYTLGGTFQLIGYAGTSAASPGFAAIQAGAEQVSGRTIGFANPLLYRLSRAGVLHDVTEPTAPVTAVRDLGADQGDLRYVLFTLGQDYGLSATTGYDAATGLGSPGPAYLSWFRRH
ncbi:peptidase S53 propeptide [Actinoplanes sp. SE50]|uniref:S53 family peptidase n=1 Tax=unclassified Actinoplanes TaxID=2626549 RepID=UPI00023EBDE5|nr:MULTISPECIES: S53 family peptidase [unclassified Actinoplanes]AEV86899.1 peptidase S53 propeptide [Actinoplanes sp. SE50/110]ATO85296.1 peptidase S53 propeptide [Actinoplanes sp. SE50]SLM02706.1 Pseudomonalisin precursor [Actinoplanes sp. SE50/110]